MRELGKCIVQCGGAKGDFPGSLAPVLGGEGWGEGHCLQWRCSPEWPLTLPSPLSTGEREVIEGPFIHRGCGRRPDEKDFG